MAIEVTCNACCQPIRIKWRVARMRACRDVEQALAEIHGSARLLASYLRDVQLPTDAAAELGRLNARLAQVDAAELARFALGDKRAEDLARHERRRAKRGK